MPRVPYEKISLEDASYRDIERWMKRGQEDPEWWVRNILGVKHLWAGQSEILKCINKCDRITVKSGHAMGKDFLGGALALWFLCSYTDSVVITTAATGRQVDKVMWGEIQRLYNNSTVPLGGKMLSRELRMGDMWYCIGFTTKDEGDGVGKFQGFRNKNVLVIISEAQAVEDTIFDQIDTLLVTENSKLVLLGNPLRTDGKFYQSFRDPSFKQFTFSCYDSPNVTRGKEVIPGMVTRKWINDKERRWVKGTPMFETRVIGNFPKHATDTLLSLDDAKKATEVRDPVKGYRVIAVDPARTGADKTAITLMEGGYQQRIEAEQGRLTTETTGKLVHMIRRFRPHRVVIDEGAMGAGVVDQLLEMMPVLEAQKIVFDLVPFQFGGKPADSKFTNLGSEAWFTVCKNIMAGKVKLVDDDDLLAQLTARKYTFTSTGKLGLEQKKELKKRGLPSPDMGDATVMGFYYSIEDDFNENIDEDNKKKLDDPDADLEVSERELVTANPLTGYPQ